MDPKDHAFHLHERFGPTLALPPAERIKKGLTDIPEATIAQWVEEFKQVNHLIGELAREGGSPKLTSAVVRRRIQERFPFLQQDGLRQAMFLVDYMAWHDG